jgi:hypothetical protein
MLNAVVNELLEKRGESYWCMVPVEKPLLL